MARVRGHQAGERGPRAGERGTTSPCVSRPTCAGLTPEMSIDGAGCGRVACPLPDRPRIGDRMMFVGGYLFWSFVAIVGIAWARASRR